MKKGEVVTLTHRPTDSEWWYAKVDDRMGYVPSAYVNTDNVESARGDTPTEAPAVDAGSFKPLVSEALFAYASEEAGDLVFEAGETIQVLK